MDSRIFVHYYRTTVDGRIMLGKGGNTSRSARELLKTFDEPSPYRPMLTDALHRFIPELKPGLSDVPIAASWNGASERSATGLPFFSRLNDHPDVFYGFGYSGNGVGPTYMGGQFLSSLALGLDNAWTRSPIPGDCSAGFRPSLSAISDRFGAQRDPPQGAQRGPRSPARLDRPTSGEACGGGRQGGHRR